MNQPLQVGFLRLYSYRDKTRDQPKLKEPKGSFFYSFYSYGRGWYHYYIPLHTQVISSNGGDHFTDISLWLRFAFVCVQAASLSVSNEFKSGRLLAYKLMCVMTVCRHDVPLTQEYLTHFYRLMHIGLTGTDQVSHSNYHCHHHYYKQKHHYCSHHHSSSSIIDVIDILIIMTMISAVDITITITTFIIIVIAFFIVVLVVIVIIIIIIIIIIVIVIVICHHSRLHHHHHHHRY